MAKKILLIAYHFPPSTEVGGLRIANFARCLPRFGWDPHVLTLKDEYIEKVDPGKLDYVRAVKIVKAGRTPTISQAYLVAKIACLRLLKKKASPGRTPDMDRLPGMTRWKSESIAGRLRRYALAFLSLPDAQRNWVWPAVVEAVRLIRRERIDTILTSCPPYSAHLVGLLVKQITGVRWVADFRDPWMTACSKTLYYTCGVSLSIEHWLERRVISNADLVVANTEVLREAFRKAYGPKQADRFVCVTNGFDGEFFSKFQNMEKEERFTITYTGSLYFGRTPEPIFHAIYDLIREGHIDPRVIRIRLVGHCQLIDGKPISEAIERYQLQNVVEVLEPVSQMEAIAMVKRSHLVLLLAPDQPYQIPAKVYEYMGAGTRVLALANEGATHDLIRSSKIGEVFQPTDVVGIKHFISQSLSMRINSQVEPKSELIDRFEIHSLTRSLVDHIDRISNQDK